MVDLISQEQHESLDQVVKSYTDHSDENESRTTEFTRRLNP
jgi:hypothetical protein